MENKKGGMVFGKSHDDGGEKFIVKGTGQLVELEGGEGVINKKNMAIKEKYSITGTPREIASCINEIGGNGVNFRNSSNSCNIKKMSNGGFLNEKEKNILESKKQKFNSQYFKNGGEIDSKNADLNWLKMTELVNNYRGKAIVSIYQNERKIIVVAENKILQELINYGGKLKPVDEKSKIIVWQYNAYNDDVFFEKGGRISKNWIQKAVKSFEEKGTKGKFSEQAKRHKMSTLEFAKYVLSNPEKYTMKTRKRAIFVKNTNPYFFNK